MDFSWAVPGAKVVCLRKKWTSELAALCSAPALHDVVTIREVTSLKGGVYLRFVEHDNSHMTGRCVPKVEPAFPARFFRPLRSTDIGMEILRGLLDTKPSLTDAPFHIPVDA